MKLSIIIPFHDEEENVVPVLSEVRRAQPGAEIIAVDDCSTDRTLGILEEQVGIRVLRLPRQMGQSAATYAGLIRATGDVCILMDGDGQSDPGDIKRLLEYMPQYDLVNGMRSERRDSLARRLASRVANATRVWFTRDGMRDTSGTPKALKRESVDHLVPFDALHRFIPAILKRAGFEVIEVPVAHRQRLHGGSKYTNMGRAMRGVWDLIGVHWLLARKLDVAELGVRVIGCDEVPVDGSHGPTDSALPFPESTDR